MSVAGSADCDRWTDDRRAVAALCATWYDTCGEFRGAALLHYGVSLPPEGTVARLIGEMTGRATRWRIRPRSRSSCRGRCARC